ncbi:hypothetical protein [Psychrosphaera algicola]|uniref:Uncharacterized protein n=1 Tax=Psychrosphaera algicola TaxID=3023714 RepID=A0ABT5F9B7_9GAMM|nr:hypothetical protein [Psychrosphaera sp. G1-22]MDC2888120.1 hypothetical protein [Psychrosphaera sp. G1-22]
MCSRFDGRGLNCPLGFVKAKQSLLRDKTKEYLLDDKTTLYNFIRYLEKQNITFVLHSEDNSTLVKVNL